MATVASATANFAKYIPPVVWSTETQSVIFAILSFVGAWVLVTKLIQLIFSIIWPLLILGSALILIPNFSSSWFRDDLPYYGHVMVEWSKKIIGEIHYVRKGDQYSKGK